MGDEFYSLVSILRAAAKKFFDDRAFGSAAALLVVMSDIEGEENQ